jgi:hypothetical protein
MAKKQQSPGGAPGQGAHGNGGHESGGGDHDGNGGNDGPGDYPRELYDDPGEHLEIERRRFRGGLPPTPERYALAREQWYQLPGALVRPPMDPPVDTTPASDEEPPKERLTPTTPRGR